MSGLGSDQFASIPLVARNAKRALEAARLVRSRHGGCWQVLPAFGAYIAFLALLALRADVPAAFGLEAGLVACTGVADDVPALAAAAGPRALLGAHAWLQTQLVPRLVGAPDGAWQLAPAAAAAAGLTPAAAAFFFDSSTRSGLYSMP